MSSSHPRSEASVFERAKKVRVGGGREGGGNWGGGGWGEVGAGGEVE
jgi:hypothetical protein